MYPEQLRPQQEILVNKPVCIANIRTADNLVLSEALLCGMPKAGSWAKWEQLRHSCAAFHTEHTSMFCIARDHAVAMPHAMKHSQQASRSVDQGLI